jgi:hypothetical protein
VFYTPNPGNQLDGEVAAASVSDCAHCKSTVLTERHHCHEASNKYFIDLTFATDSSLHPADFQGLEYKTQKY